MKSYLLFTDTGPIVMLTKYNSIKQPKLLEILNAKGIRKFVAHQLPLKLVKERYETHYNTVMGNPEESDELRLLEYDGQRAYNMFRFDEYGAPIYNEAKMEQETELTKKL